MNKLFETEQYKNAELRVYTSLSSLSKATGLELKMLKLAKKANLTGFRVNGTVSWVELKPVLESEWDNLVVDSIEDIAHWKRELVKQDVSLRQLQVKKLEKNLIEPDEMRQYMVELGTKLSVVIKSSLNELPPKLVGKSEPDIKILIDKCMEDIFNILKGGVEKWEKAANKKK